MRAEEATQRANEEARRASELEALVAALECAQPEPSTSGESRSPSAPQADRQRSQSGRHTPDWLEKAARRLSEAGEASLDIVIGESDEASTPIAAATAAIEEAANDGRDSNSTPAPPLPEAAGIGAAIREVEEDHPNTNLATGARSPLEVTGHQPVGAEAGVWPFLSYETFQPSSPPFVSYADRSSASVEDPLRRQWPFVSYESYPSKAWPFVSYTYDVPTSILALAAPPSYDLAGCQVSDVCQTGPASTSTALVLAVPAVRASAIDHGTSLPKALMWRHWLRSVMNTMVCK